MNLQNPPQPEPFTPPPVYEVSPQSVFRWLALGWQDMRHTGAPSLMHGLIVMVASLVIVEITVLYWPLLPGAVSGFMLTGPFLATGLYALSKKREEGNTTSFKDVLNAWRHGSHYLFSIGLLLVLSASAWVIFSVLMFHFFIDVAISTPLDFFRYVLTQDDKLFMLWAVLGGLGSALAFSITVISLPLLVERDISTRLAILTSVRTVGQNPFTMLWWAMVIFLLTGFSFITLMLGFIVLYPLLGHASWHVYRDLVDASELPLRRTAE